VHPRVIISCDVMAWRANCRHRPLVRNMHIHVIFVARYIYTFLFYHFLLRHIPLYCTHCLASQSMLFLLICLFDYVAGSVYFYTQIGFSWSSQGKILAADGAPSDYFGTSVSLDTSSALIGATYDDDKATDAGEYR
jgi:hypothetical protein